MQEVTRGLLTLVKQIRLHLQDHPEDFNVIVEASIDGFKPALDKIKARHSSQSPDLHVAEKFDRKK